jgi:hypothetical protein
MPPPLPHSHPRRADPSSSSPPAHPFLAFPALEPLWWCGAPVEVAQYVVSRWTDLRGEPDPPAGAVLRAREGDDVPEARASPQHRRGGRQQDDSQAFPSVTNFSNRFKSESRVWVLEVLLLGDGRSCSSMMQSKVCVHPCLSSTPPPRTRGVGTG